MSLDPPVTGWLPAQEHHEENIGDTPTHVIFVELKEPAPTQPETSTLGSA